VKILLWLKKNKINIDNYTIEEIKKSLDSLFYRKDEINLNEFEAYFIFPDIKGYEWNKYLILGIINSFLLDEYEIKRDNTIYYIRRMNNEL